METLDKKPTHHSDPDLPAIQQTTLPIFVTQQDVTRMIHSQCPLFTVISVRDVSEQYATHLDDRAEWLAYRQTVQSTAGRSASWLDKKLTLLLRDEEFVTLWKAAVVRTQLLCRWEVVLYRA